MQNTIKFHLKVKAGNKILTITKGHNSVVNLRKLTCNNSNLDLVKVKAYAKFDQIPSISPQNIEQKQNFDNNQGPQPCYKLMKN